VYYVVAEALTNVAKHSGAEKARVRVSVGRAGRDLEDADGPAPAGRARRDLDGDDVVQVVVTDDGVGGAVSQPGHGLAGLAGRVAAAGGTLGVVSPVGGPTRIEVTLPCA
jgi:signal transduction histidine kinase